MIIKFNEFINEGLFSKIKDTINPSDDIKKRKILELMSESDSIGLNLDRIIKKAFVNKDGETFLRYIDDCSNILYNVNKIEKLSKNFIPSDKKAAIDKIIKCLKYINTTFPSNIKSDKMDGFILDQIIDVINNYNKYAEKYNVNIINISKFNKK